MLVALFSLCIVSTVGRGVFLELDVGTIPAIPLSAAKSVERVGEIWSNCTMPNDKADILNVIIMPDPPQKGQNVTITATLNIKEEITGGKIDIKLKVGFLPIHETLDLCDTLQKAGQTCPIQKGTTTNKITQEVPNDIPSVRITGTVKVKDQNGMEIICIEVDLHL